MTSRKAHPRKHFWVDVELTSDHLAHDSDAVIDLVVTVNGVECIRWPYANDGVLAHHARRKIEV